MIPLSESGRRRIRVMVVDDSAVVRGFLVRILESDPGIEVAATCSNGQTAVLQLPRIRPDIVVLDIEMPVMDGLAALPRLLACDPSVRVIMASTLTQKNAEISLEALALGAVDYIPKPSSSQLNGNSDFRRQLVEKVLALGRIEPTSRSRPEHKRPSEPAPTFASVRHPAILAIGSSTGGPQALLTVLKQIAHLKAPIVIAQHMPATFTAILAQQLSKSCGRPCKEAQHGETISAGHTYVAPGDYHFSLNRDAGVLKAILTQAPPENFCRPSVNPLFRSVARLFGADAIALMLTGMGSDGLDGTRDIAAAGGTVVAQDEQSSIVWGMPGAIVHAGLCSAVLPLGGIASHLNTLFSGVRR